MDSFLIGGTVFFPDPLEDETEPVDITEPTSMR